MLLDLSGHHHALRRVSSQPERTGNGVKGESDTEKASGKSEKDAGSVPGQGHPVHRPWRLRAGKFRVSGLGTAGPGSVRSTAPVRRHHGRCDSQTTASLFLGVFPGQCSY